MKKCLFVLIAFLSTLTITAQSEKAIYIYRNDGDFNAFLCEDIDSLVHSNIGIDSICYDKMVVQEIWTQDSIYRIPLAAIDSISFSVPEPIVNDKVSFIELDYLPYIQKIDGLTMWMESGTPTRLVPQLGTILVSNCFDGVLENGFSGRVISCNQQGGSIVIECEEVGLTDIYDRLISVGKCESTNSNLEASGTRKRAYGTHNFDLGNFSASIGPVNISDNPQVTISWVFFIDNRLVVMEGSRYHPIIQLLFKHSHDLSLKIKSQVDGEYEPEPIWKIESPAIRIPQIPGFYARVRLGGFWSAHGSVNLDATLSGNLTFVNGFKWDEGGFETINKMTNRQFNRPEISFNMEGSIEGGVAARLVAGIGSERIASMDATLRLGPQLALNFSLTDKGLENGTLYSSLKDSKLSINAYGKLSAGYTTIGDRIMGSDHNRHDIPLTLSWDHNVHSWNILPEFSELEVKKSMSDLSATIRCTPEKDILIPLGLGIGLYNEDGTLVDRLFNAQDYKREKEGYVIEQTFNSLEREKEYIAKPLIRIFGTEMAAVPTKTFKIGRFPVTLSDFKVTKSQFKKGAFTHEGNKYDYRFDVSVTATLDEDAEDIADWGYMYQDPFGNPPAKISLKNFGYSYTDTRYAYFRNENPSICTLYGYVMYMNSDKPVYGEPQDFPLMHNDDIKVFTGNSTASYTEAQCWGSATLNDDPNAIYSVADECGFFYNLIGVPQNGNAMKQTCIMGSDGLFDATLSGLTEDTLYYFTAFVRVGEDFYYGVPESFKTKKKVPDPEPIAITGEHYNETATTATIECIYINVPDNADCGYYISKSYYDNASRSSRISAGIEWNKVSIGRYEGLKTINLYGLLPNEEYQYYAYISVGNEDVATGTTNSFITKTPIATTGDYSNVTKNSATVSCTYENVPEGGVCGVEYTWNGGSTKQTVGSSNGTQSVTLSGLQPGTSYTYCAYIEANGQTYYGGDKTFTTKEQIPDVVGTWQGTQYLLNGNVYETFILTLNADGTAEIDETGENIMNSGVAHGTWSVNANGAVGVSIVYYSTDTQWSTKSFSGTVDNVDSPSRVEGKVYWSRGHVMGGYADYENTFVMTR